MVKTKVQDDALLATMPKSGNRRKSKDVTVRIKMGETVDIEQVTNPLTKNKSKKKAAVVDDDEKIFEKDITDTSSDELIHDGSDDSDVSFEELPWAKKGNKKNADTSNQENSTSRKTTPSASVNKSSETAIPKKKRELEDVAESSEPSIPKKKREIDDIDLLTESIAPKSNEPIALEPIIALGPVANIAVTKITPMIHAPVSSGNETLPGDSKRIQANNDMSRGSVQQNNVLDKPPLPRAINQTTTTEPAPQPISSFVSDKLRNDVNSLIELVYKDKDRQRTTPLETVDMVRLGY